MRVQWALEGISVGFVGCRRWKALIPLWIRGLCEIGFAKSHDTDTCGLVPDLWALCVSVEHAQLKG